MAGRQSTGHKKAFTDAAAQGRQESRPALPPPAARSRRRRRESPPPSPRATQTKTLGDRSADASPSALFGLDPDVCPGSRRRQHTLGPRNTHARVQPRARQCLLWGGGSPASLAPPAKEPTSHTPPPNREGLSRGPPAGWGGPRSLFPTPRLTEVSHTASQSRSGRKGFSSAGKASSFGCIVTTETIPETRQAPQL